ncbi:hypothetical protein J7M23_07395 [Candidatus Sumerlaeota bacterium]|nr:hypothetical protein [Candidatus Sumerlaeota bacterium]
MLVIKLLRRVRINKKVYSMQNIGIFIRQVKETIQRFDLIHPQETILVAVSGGPDSIALALCLQKMASELKIRPVLLHINHFPARQRVG